MCRRNAQKQDKKGHFVTCDTYVTMTDGTGIVHIAPAFGEDDANVGRNYDLPFVQFVDGKGDLTAETPFAGIFVKKCRSCGIKGLDARERHFCSMHRSLSMSIHTAGDVILRLSTMQENHGSSR